MIKKLLNILIIYPIIYVIKLYQYIISPILKTNCRYLPTCSEYSISALKEHGLFMGIYYSSKRILSFLLNHLPNSLEAFKILPRLNSEELLSIVIQLK